MRRRPSRFNDCAKIETQKTQVEVKKKNNKPAKKEKREKISW